MNLLRVLRFSDLVGVFVFSAMAWGDVERARIKRRTAMARHLLRIVVKGCEFANEGKSEEASMSRPEALTGS